MNAAYGSLEVALPLFIHRQLHASAELMGLTWMIYAIGTLAGASLNVFFGKRPMDRRIPMVMICLWAGAIMSAGLAADSWILLISFAIAGISFKAYPPFARTIVQSIVPTAIRGRVFSFRSAVTVAGSPIGGGLAGMVIASHAPSFMIFLVGISVLVFGINSC
ncbi:MAG: MFS transporter, partial [Firmicutes bacterium]|nr:MFS transporter [Bacillota bacterium]